jgi:hypothetical protein
MILILQSRACCDDHLLLARVLDNQRLQSRICGLNNPGSGSVQHMLELPQGLCKLKAGCEMSNLIGFQYFVYPYACHTVDIRMCRGPRQFPRFRRVCVGTHFTYRGYDFVEHEISQLIGEESNLAGSGLSFFA